MVSDISDLDLGFDVVIVGAGAAGCTLANSLSNKFKVLLVDSKTFPRKKACSGILVSEGKDFFGQDLDDSIFIDPKELDLEYLDINNNKKKFVTKNFYNTSRFELDQFLLKKINLKKHVTFLQNAKVVGFTSAADKKHEVVVCESKGVIKPIITKYLVGCDGALSTIRRKFFKKEIPFYVGIQELIKVERKIDKAYFIFDNEITDFYSWIIPKGDFVEVGSLLDPFNSKLKFNLFKNLLKERFDIVGEGDIDSAIVLRPSSIKDVCLGKGNILLCGEAAGLISPSSAEGISYALRSAKFCADALNQNQSNPFKIYSKNCKPLISRLEGKVKKSKILSNPKQRNKLFS
jgi:geranylgeranyl diphosphate/geranylgeranyl-bacteriochlorophyllide a reductase